MISVFQSNDFDNHEEVTFFSDSASGLKAIIAVHSTALGPALGGCRMWPYASEEAALTDVLRLSQGMTYKSAISDLPLGGGKSVIIGDPRKDKTDELFLAMGRCLEKLGGRYIVAEDSGTTVADLQMMAQQTDFVSGVNDRKTATGEIMDGDPSPATAYGVFQGIKAAVKTQLQSSNLEGMRVAIQGVGSVGYRLGEYLHAAGAELWVSDIYEERLTRAAEELNAHIVDPKEIYALDVDVFSPCALGAVINDMTIPYLKTKIIAGAANNQLAESRHGEVLMDKGILYAPDFAINAGGVIDIACYQQNDNYEAMLERVGGIHDTLLKIFELAKQQNIAPHLVASRMAESRFKE